MSQGPSRSPLAAARPNRFAYTVETAGGVSLGACQTAALAFAMYRAAADEFFSHNVLLKHGDEIVAGA